MTSWRTAFGPLVTALRGTAVSFDCRCRFALFHAVPTQPRAGVAEQTWQADGLFAVGTLTHLVLCQAASGRAHLHQTHPSPTIRFLRKGLLLEGIHARETTDTGLIEFDDFRLLCAALNALQQGPLQLAQTFVE